MTAVASSSSRWSMKSAAVEVGLVAGGDQLGRSRCRGRRRATAASRGCRRSARPADAARREVLHLQRAGGRQHDAVGQVDQADGVRAQDAHRAGGLASALLAARALRARLADSRWPARWPPPVPRAARSRTADPRGRRRAARCRHRAPPAARQRRRSRAGRRCVDARGFTG